MGRGLEALPTLEDIGAQVDLIGSRSCEILILRDRADGVTDEIALPAECRLHQITPAYYYAVALPATLEEDGGVHADADARDFILAMQAAGKLVIWLPRPEQAVVSAVASAAPNRGALMAFQFCQLLASFFGAAAGPVRDHHKPGV